jgi:hypothetical protein
MWYKSELASIGIIFSSGWYPTKNLPTLNKPLPVNLIMENGNLANEQRAQFPTLITDGNIKGAITVNNQPYELYATAKIIIDCNLCIIVESSAAK